MKKKIDFQIINNKQQTTHKYINIIMVSHKEQPININISKDANVNSSNVYNEFKDHIIKNNIELHKELKEACRISQEFDERLKTNEIMLDKYDERMRYMKGLLQNLNELRGDYSKVILRSENISNLIREHNKKSKKMYYDIYVYLIIINLMNIIVPFNFNYISSIFSVNIIYLILQISYIICFPYIIILIKDKYYCIKNLSKEDTQNVKNISDEIKKIKLEIKKTEDSCISIDNWIYEI